MCSIQLYCLAPPERVQLWTNGNCSCEWEGQKVKVKVTSFDSDFKVAIFLTLNISETTRDRAIVTIDHQ